MAFKCSKLSAAAVDYIQVQMGVSDQCCSCWIFCSRVCLTWWCDFSDGDNLEGFLNFFIIITFKGE